jgi:NAD(P)-dependent dehydrogenase (short-subunit alcohol dehydrogenase family)
MLGLARRVHVITGGYGGIATATATGIAQAGGIAVITGRQLDKGLEAAEVLRARTGGDVRFYALDVTDSRAVRDAALRIEAEVGPVHGLVANAGIARHAPTFTYEDDDWRATFAVNLDGAFYCAREFGRLMRGRGGSVVFVSSIAARVATKPPLRVVYGASKAAMSHLASLLGVEWGAEGIRVNVVEPGFTATSVHDRARAKTPELLEMLAKETPIGRFLDPREIANVILFLLSDLSSAMTGAVVVADGGYSKK